MFLKNMTIRTKLILFMFLLLLIPSLTIGISGYYSAKNEVSHQISQAANGQVDLLNEITNQFFKNKKDAIQLFSENLTRSDFKNVLSVNKMLESMNHSFDEAVLTYVGTDKGDIYSYPKMDFPSDYNPRVRDWYKLAEENKGTSIVTKPYKDIVTGKMVVTIASTLSDGSGVMAMDVDLNVLEKTTLHSRIGNKGYPSLVDHDGKFVVHPAIKPGEKLDKYIKKSLVKNMYKRKDGSFEYEYKGEGKYMTYSTNKETGWKVLGTVNTSEFSDQSAPILINTAIIVAVFIILGIVLNIFFIRSIITRIRSLSIVARKVSEGDLTNQVDIKSNDEFGQLGNAFNTMILSLRTLLSRIERSSETLVTSSRQVEENVVQVSVVTKDIAHSVVELSSGAETQMVCTEETAKAIQEIASGIQHVAERASSAGYSVSKAADQTQQGNVYIEKAIRQMDEIHDSVEETTLLVQDLGNKSSEINKIVEVITGISEQTNLLALNAAIEAARAGEHGKGFAVVANEVRKLADGSKQSAQQITTLIHSIQEQIDQVVENIQKEKIQTADGLLLMKETGVNFSAILHAVEDVSNQMQEVSATAEQMSAGSEEVTASVEEMASISSESSSSAEQVAAGAQQQFSSIEGISESITHLAGLADELKEEVAKFKVK